MLHLVFAAFKLQFADQHNLRVIFIHHIASRIFRISICVSSSFINNFLVVEVAFRRAYNDLTNHWTQVWWTDTGLAEAEIWNGSLGKGQVETGGNVV